MPIHDWTRVDAGIFHDFHNAWLTEIRNVLNNGALPEGYYALTEQHAGRIIPDVLALRHCTAQREPTGGVSPSWTSVGRRTAAGPMEADSLGGSPNAASDPRGPACERSSTRRPHRSCLAVEQGPGRPRRRVCCQGHLGDSVSEFMCW